MTESPPRIASAASAASVLPGGLPPGAAASLFQAVRGLHNTRALAAMLGCMVVGVLVAGVFSLLAARLGAVVALLGGLALLMAAATGVNAAGMLLMDQARGLPARALADAVRGGLACVPKAIALGLGLLLIAVGVALVIALAYFICKIPYLGPLLFVAVFPLSVLIAGVTLCGLFLCLFLSLPALWEGRSIGNAITQSIAVARTRLVETLLLSAVVGVLSAAVGVIVFGVLATGLMPMLGLSAAILGDDSFGSVALIAQGGTEFGHGGSGVAGASGGHATAAAVGGGVLWSLAASLVAMVNLLGLNLVYLRVTEGLGAAAAGTATPMFGSGGTATPTAAAPSRAQPAGATLPSAVKSSTCPECLSAVGTEDVFCGVCGHRLK